MICLLIKVVLLLPAVLLAAITLSQKQKLDSLATMLLAAAVPSLYLGAILYSGLELWVYAKITGENLENVEQANSLQKSEAGEDIESGT